MPGCGGISLAEGLEQPRQPVHRDADARVANREMQVPGLGRILRLAGDGEDLHLDDDFAGGGEFDAVAEEIDQDLPQGGSHRPATALGMPSSI